MVPDADEGMGARSVPVSRLWPKGCAGDDSARPIADISMRMNLVTMWNAYQANPAAILRAARPEQVRPDIRDFPVESFSLTGPRATATAAHGHLQSNAARMSW